MTVAEVQRALEGAVYRMKVQAQFDYSLANLFGFSIARTLDKNAKMPTIEEAYPDLFEAEEDTNEQEQDELVIENSKNRFMAWAMAHNAKMRKGVENPEL